MPETMTKDLSIPFEVSLDILKMEEDEKGDWIIEGFAATTDLDLQNEIVTQDAINDSAKDLEGNSTVLLNHDQKNPIGRVVESEARKGGLFIKVLISKTVPDTWTKIKELVLNKFSVRGKVVEAVKEWSADLGKFIKVIKKMFLVEVSLVSVPANPNAKAMRWYIEKAFDLWESKGGELQTITKSGGQVMGGTTGATDQSASGGVPEIFDDKGNLKKTIDFSKVSDEIIKQATAHQQLLDEKTGAIQKLAKELSEGASTMTPVELKEKIRQLESLGWKLDADAQVVQIAGGSSTEEGKADGDPAGDETGKADGDDSSKADAGTIAGDETKKGEGEDGEEVKKGFPAPGDLYSQWGEFCKKNDLVDELDEEKVFAKWLDFCKENAYPAPFAYPYAEAEKADGAEVKAIVDLVDNLMEGADDAAKAVLGQIKSLLSRMLGGAAPNPTPKPPVPGQPVDSAKANVGEDETIKAARLSTLSTIIEKLQGLGEGLTPEISKQLETMTKNLADEQKAAESLEELKKTLAVEARQSLTDIMAPIEKRLDVIESIEGIQKSEKGQEKTPDEKSKTGGTSSKDSDGSKKSVWGGILGNSLAKATGGYGIS